MKLPCISPCFLLLLGSLSAGQVHAADAGTATTNDAPGLALFETKIRPMLIEHCYECHSAESGQTKGGLSLDTKQGLLSGGDSGPAIVPGAPSASLLLTAISHTDPHLKMPKKKAQLPPSVIADVGTWISLGAPDPREGKTTKITVKSPAKVGPEPQYWSYRKPVHQVPPQVKPPAAGLGDLDRFILAKLDAAGLSPSPPAGKVALIRRATFDLTGLPPSSAEVEAFLGDNSPEAYARIIERLLASPHYGEHWARHWLDVARYSDTKGYVYAREEKRFVHAAPYRDWVVTALNEDMGYDRFLLRQIAADQVEPAGSPHLAAMGFLTLGRRFLGVTHDIIDDRIDVLMRGTLGLTVGCARCHDHKFDPIPTRDYYALYGVFQSCTEKLVPSAPPSRDEAFAAKLHALETKLQTTLRLRRDEQATRVRATLSQHLTAQLELEKYPEEAFGQLLDAQDLNPVVVRRWQRHLEKARVSHDPIFTAWHAFAKLTPADFPQQAAAVSSDLTRRQNEGHPLVTALFTKPPANMVEVAERYGALFADLEKQWQDHLKIRPEAKALPDPSAEVLRQLLYGPDSPCLVPDEAIANIEMFFPNNVVVELWRLQGDVDRVLMEPSDAPAHAVILEDRAQPVTARIFKRGNPLTKGDEAPRQFLQALSGDTPRLFTRGSGRLELAQAITDPANPLTARVMVNRVWMHHFGQGLVTTPSDFGVRAEPPSHPELLDWLALRFMDRGWSIKELHRLIMLSSTYQQSSQGPDHPAALRLAQERDADNRLLWRMNVHRLSFEEARDAWLAAAGHLDARVGGRPQDLFADSNTRRTLYATVDREDLAPVLRTFDFANPDLSIPRRTETTVPQQALFAMNHPFLAAQARALAGRKEVQACRTDAERIALIYALLYQRTPEFEELQAALDYVRDAAAPERLAIRETAKAWQYGYGGWDEEAGRMKNFTALPRLKDRAWQGGSRWPDVTLGWAQLTPKGGHPGNDKEHAVVRRWTAPADGDYIVESLLKHEPAAGDGIRAFVSQGSRGQLRAVTLHQSESVMNLDGLSLKAGDKLDFVVDIGNGLNSDQFLWSPRIRSAGSAGSGGDVDAQVWDAEADFPEPTDGALDPWAQLVQVLMLANEFMFVD